MYDTPDIISLDTLQTHRAQLIKEQCEAQETNPSRYAFLAEVLNWLPDTTIPALTE